MHKGICHSHQWDSTKKHRPSIIVHTDSTEHYGDFEACWRCHLVKPAVSRVKYRLWSTFVAPITARKSPEPF